MTKSQPKRSGAWEGMAGGQAVQVRLVVKVSSVKFVVYSVGNWRIPWQFGSKEMT